MGFKSSKGGALYYNTLLPTVEDASSYGALSNWAKVENVENTPVPKVTSEDGTFTLLESGWTIHTIGPNDIPNVDVVAAFDESDCTNIEALRAYSNTGTALAWKFLNSAGRAFYWKGTVNDFGSTDADGKNHDARNFQIRNSGTALVEVAPA